MYDRMDEELFVEQNHHILHGAQDLGLNAKGPVRLAESNKSAQNVWAA